MKNWAFFSFVYMLASSCAPPDGSNASPFYVDRASAVTPATGSTCAPFPSLSNALVAAALLSTATISLQSAASLPAFSVSNSIQILANSHGIDLPGTVSISGKLEISAATLISVSAAGYSFDVFEGILSLITCEMSGFSSNPINIRGQVLASNCIFRDNSKGVFMNSRFGGTITISNSQFYSNAAVSGAVLLLYPVTDAGVTTISFTNCEFQGNGINGGNSVVALNDLGIGAPMGSQTILFSKCSFKGNLAAPFQLANKVFNVTIDSCTFENEPQIIIGSLTMTNLILSNSHVFNSKGPLVSLTMSGQLRINSSNFTNIDTGPVVYAIGKGPATSLISLSQVLINFIDNPGSTVFGNLINAISTTIWLTDVRMSNFTGQMHAMFYISQAVLYSQGLSFYNGSAPNGVIGSLLFSTVVMNNTLFDYVNSRGSMSYLTASSVAINRMTFRNVQGYWDVNALVYTTNFFIINPGAVVTIGGLIGEFAVPGTTTIYVNGGKCVVSNSNFVGPLGMGLFTVLAGSLSIRTSTFDLTRGRAFGKLLLSGYFDIDVLHLRDLTLTSPIITISSQSITYIKSLILTNVTTIALGKGQEFTLIVDSAQITRSAVSSLVHFSIGVNVVIGGLIMRDCIGHLFSLFDSNISISNVEIVNMMNSQMIMYLSHSRVDINSGVISNLTFNDAGSLITALDQSAVRLNSLTLRDMTSSEHGVISLQQSSMSLTACTMSGFNMSLIVAEESAISISNSEVKNILISLEGKTLSMLPNGGFISCTDCSIVYITNSRFSDISANEGGVIYAQATKATLNVEIILEKSRFERCTGKTNGGALKIFEHKVTIKDCSFEANHAYIGGVIVFQAVSKALFIANSSFTRNSAALDGSCLRWTGLQPVLSNNTYANNSALYGDPQASTPHHFTLLRSDTQQPLTQFPVIGVTGQQIKQPLVIGVFDALGQLIVTDNSTLVAIAMPAGIEGSGNNEALAAQGIASFSRLFSPFSTSTYNFTFFSAKTNIANLTVQCKFRDCQPGEIRTSTGCIPCPKNSYSFDPSDSSCTLCPPHAMCYGKTVVSLEVDYWRPNNLTDDIYPCLMQNACLGGINSDCVKGNTGVLCGACESGYYKYGMWDCRECGGEIPQAGRGVIIAVLVVSAVSVPSQLFLKQDGILYKIALLYRVFYNYAHTFLFVVLLHVKWPFSTLAHHEVWRTIGSLGQTLVYSGCQYTDMSIGDYFFQVVAAAFYPLLLIIASIVIWSLAEIKLKYSLKQLIAAILSASIIAIYNFAPALSLMVISMYQCTEVAGDSWLVADSSQECWTGSHLLYIFSLTIPLLCFLVAVYIFAIWCILHRSSNEVFKFTNKYLTAGYKQKYTNWEIRVMLRKCMLVLLSIAYPKLDKFSQIMLFASIIGMGTHAEAKRMPYISKWLNFTNTLANVSIVIIVFTAADGTEPQLTALSCFCSFVVVAVGCASLLPRICTDEQKYAKANLRSSPSSQQRPGLSSAQSGDVSDSTDLKPPPGTPAEVDLRDIKLIEASF